MERGGNREWPWLYIISLVEEHIIDTDGAAFDSRMMYTQRSQFQETGRVGIGGDVGTGGDSICWEGPRLHLRTSTPRNCQEIQEKHLVVLLSLKGCVAKLGCQGLSHRTCTCTVPRYYLTQKTLQVNTQEYNHLTLPLFAVYRPF